MLLRVLSKLKISKIFWIEQYFIYSLNVNEYYLVQDIFVARSYMLVFIQISRVINLTLDFIIFLKDIFAYKLFDLIMFLSTIDGVPFLCCFS